ncbi:MAG: hypothetical protein ACLP5H_18980 [Desulfomonilaceae bacterium]
MAMAALRAYHGHHAQTICADSPNLFRFKGQLLINWGLCVYITMYNYIYSYTCMPVNANREERIILNCCLHTGARRSEIFPVFLGRGHQFREAVSQPWNQKDAGRLYGTRMASNVRLASWRVMVVVKDQAH